MAADKSLIQGAAALAKADSAMGSAFTKGAAAGAAPVTKQLFLNIEKENKLENEMIKRAEDINMKIMTNPNLAGEYHNDIKNEATSTRTAILDIAKDKSLSRSERNRLITEKVDGFNSITSKYLVGQKAEALFLKGIEKGGYSKEDPELNKNANEISKYFAGEEGKEIDRTETGYVFKKFNGGEDLIVNYNQIDNYIPKVKDEVALKTLNQQLNSEAKLHDLKDAGAATLRILQNFGEDQQKNLLANTYGVDVKNMPPKRVTEELAGFIAEDYKGRVTQDPTKQAEINRGRKINQFKTLFGQLDNLKVNKSGGRSGGEFSVSNLPSNYSTFPQEFEDEDGKVKRTGNIDIVDNSTGIQITVTPTMGAKDIAKKLKGVYRQQSINLGDDFGFFTPLTPPN
jgi:hypothetical protein